MSNHEKSNHDMISAAMAPHRGNVLTTKQIRRCVLDAFPLFSPGSLLPNDHAEGNKCPCWCAGTPDRIFDRKETGKYFVRVSASPALSSEDRKLEDKRDFQDVNCKHLKCLWQAIENRLD